ncbi:MAG: hypothetical protein ACTHOH_10915 [Lysobacteraceae bacterium]
MNASRKDTIPAAALALACLALLPAAAMASNWEMTSGLATQKEVHTGNREVRACAGGGAVSVGTVTLPTGSTDLLIERLNVSAGLIWRNQYDTGGRPERAAKVAEFRDGTGFAVVGSLDPVPGGALNSYFTITKFDCSGNPVWRFFYGDTVDYNSGFDILQTGSGDAAAGTAAGDLVALGKYYKPAAGGLPAVYRARIARTRSAGAAIWVRDYQAAIAGDFELQAIAELPPVAPSLTGDLVAVGKLNGETTLMQVNGNNGNVVCTARTTGLGTAQFHDVVGVKTTTTPEVLAIGETTPASGGTQQVYLARFVSNCLLRVHTVWGSSGDRQIGWSNDLTLATTYTGAPAGVLVIAGEVNGPYGTQANSQDAFTHLAHPQSLLPYVLPTGAPVIGKRYGTQGPLAEKAYAVSAGSNGAYFAGSTSTDWLANGDPLHALTVRPDASGFKTVCSVDWNPPANALPLSSGIVDVTLIAKTFNQLPVPTRIPLPNQQPCCAIVP